MGDRPVRNRVQVQISDRSAGQYWSDATLYSMKLGRLPRSACLTALPFIGARDSNVPVGGKMIWSSPLTLVVMDAYYSEEQSLPLAHRSIITTQSIGRARLRSEGKDCLGEDDTQCIMSHTSLHGMGTEFPWRATSAVHTSSAWLDAECCVRKDCKRARSCTLWPNVNVQISRHRRPRLMVSRYSNTACSLERSSEMATPAQENIKSI